MRGAHGDGIAHHIQRGVESSDGDLEGRVSLSVGGQILFAVHQHIVVVGAGPDDGGGHPAVGHGQGRRAFHGGAAGAALEGHVTGVGSVGRCFRRSRLGVGDTDGMVVPLALGAEDGQLEVLVQSLHRDVEAVDLIGQAVGVGDGVGGGLEPVPLVGFGVSGHADVEVDDLLGDEADVEGHLTVLHGQGSLAVVGLVGMEHGAVGVKVGGVDAVGQSSLCCRFGSCLAHGRGGRSLGGRGRAGRGAGCAAAGERTSQHSAGQQKSKFMVQFHDDIPRSIYFTEKIITRNGPNSKQAEKEIARKGTPFRAIIESEAAFASRVHQTARIFARRQGNFPQQSWADCKGKQRSMRAKRPPGRCAMITKTAS